MSNNRQRPFSGAQADHKYNVAVDGAVMQRQRIKHRLNLYFALTMKANYPLILMWLSFQ